MPTPFSVMTWNVENLFPPGYAISPTKVITDAEYQAKLDYLEQRIREIRPDVLALQEIGGRSLDDRQSFDDLGDRLNDLLPHRALSTHPDQRPGGGGIRVGFLSRLPIVESDEVVDFAEGELAEVPNWAPSEPTRRMGRGALRIDVEPAPGTRVRLVATHLKSKLVTYPPIHGHQPRFDTNDENERARGAGLALMRRTAESVTVRSYLNGLMGPDEQAHVILLGDLNDEPHAATTQLLLGPEDNDVTTQDRRDPVRLYNLGDSIPLQGARTKEFLPPAERFSRIYKDRRELIDHILVSRGLLGAPAEIKQDKWLVQEVHSVVDSIQGQSIGDDPAARVGKDHPDHAPVYARFEL